MFDIQHVIDKSPDGFISIKKNMEIFYVNSKIEEITGLKKQEIVGRKFNEIGLIPEDFLCDVKEKFNLCVEKNRPTFHSFDIINKKTNKAVTLDVRSNPIIENNVTVGVCSALRINSRQKDLNTIDLEFATNNIGYGILAFNNENNKITFLNKATKSIFKNIDVNDSFFEIKNNFFDHEEGRKIDIALSNGVATSINFTFENQIYDVLLYPVNGKDGDIYRYTVFFNNITDRKNLEHKIQRNLNFAKIIQKGAINNTITNEHIITNSRYLTSDKLGGDLFGCVEISKGVYGVVILDVMGHGIASSLVSLSAASILRYFITNHKTPKSIAKHINNHMCFLFEGEKENEIPYYFTAIFLLIDTNKKCITYVNAGHPPAFIKGHKTDYNIVANNIPVGIQKNHLFRESKVSFDTNDSILLYTDGLLDVAGDDVDKSILSLKKEFSSYNPLYAETFLESLIHSRNLESERKDDVSILLLNLLPKKE